jgi:hypothetical protein
LNFLFDEKSIKKEKGSGKKKKRGEGKDTEDGF